MKTPWINATPLVGIQGGTAAFRASSAPHRLCQSLIDVCEWLNEALPIKGTVLSERCQNNKQKRTRFVIWVVCPRRVRPRGDDRADCGSGVWANRDGPIFVSRTGPPRIGYEMVWQIVIVT